MILGNQVIHSVECPICQGKGSLTYFFPLTIFYNASQEESWCFACLGVGSHPVSLSDNIKLEFCMEVVSHKTTDRLVEKLKKSLDKQGVPYTQIYYNGRYEYKKSTYIYGWTVEVGDKSRTVSWCEEAGWRWDTQMPPTMDPKQILRRKLLPLKEILRLKRELEEEEDG